MEADNVNSTVVTEQRPLSPNLQPAPSFEPDSGLAASSARLLPAAGAVAVAATPDDTPRSAKSGEESVTFERLVLIDKFARYPKEAAAG